MKILQVISHYVPAYRFGGPLQVAHALAKALVHRGHQVSVCATHLADLTTDLDVPLDQPVDVDGVTVFYEAVPRWRKWGYSPALRRRVDLLMPDADFVLVHNHFQYAGWMGAARARRLGKPYIVFPHASLKRQSIRSSSGLAKRMYLWVFERQNYQHAEGIAFNAEEELADSLFADRGILVPNGIDPRDFEMLPSRGAVRSRDPAIGNRLLFLFLGRIDITQKALDVILQAFANRVQAGSEAMLVLAGPSEGEDQIRLREMVTAFRLSERVFFTGLVSGEEKFQLLRDADVFLMPSRYEGLSIALLEAMASGLPIVLSDRCGLHREIERKDCGLVVQPSVESVTAAMANMEDPSARAMYGRHARELALAHYTWPRIAEGLETLMRARVTHD
ncbi:hypothetical protein CKO25_19815 [Thiocapsa imhoffii]|uniref:Glycosyltransferase n=1 Tax=Thiocapsa imhoffii TaxID=382777 RepID=A0A9X0WM66_9GAMM|nr:glycosyltransferase [Thiocapsa imhoffii]MBK1646839.1 hypothetical protein [Thiocapsa imhoffii]